MASSLTEIAYRTIQQGRSLAGLAHKELSSKAMELLAPDVVPSTEPVPVELLNELRRSLSALQDIDWEESEQGLYPNLCSSISPGWSGLSVTHAFGLIFPQIGPGEGLETSKTS